MATVQSSYFTKDGKTDILNCKVLATSNIGVEAIVTFSSAEIGKRYWVNWDVKMPNGSYMYPSSDYVYVTATTTFVNKNKLTGFVVGDYTITKTDLFQG